MYTIGKEFRFEAAHHLPQMPEDHQCHRLHGHGYRVVLELAAPEARADHMVFDFGQLAPFKLWIDKTLDHRCLNDVMRQTTAEAVARHLFELALDVIDLPADVRLAAVTVWETATCWAEYRP